jgi:hypothetical protein
MTKKMYPVVVLGLALTLSASFSTCSAQTIAQPLTTQDQQLPPNDKPQSTILDKKDVSSFTAAYNLEGKKKSSKAETITTMNVDENTVLLRNKATLTMMDAVLNKTGDTSNTDSSNFNGQNAIFLATGSSNAMLSDSILNSSSEGSNAIFATGSATKISVSNVKIHTTGNSSRGLDATYAGTISANNVDITTAGTHSAALATDRGEGTIAVTKAVLATSGEGSPCIYSTGNITLNEGVGIATNSECAVVEGKNSITLNNTSLSSSAKHGIMLYQSFSGDANEGIAHFTAKDSKLTANASGPMFYITNTTAEVTLENTELRFDDGILIQATSDKWGTQGSNGGNFTFTGIHQKLTGNVLANNLSSISLNLTQNTDFSGAVNPDNTAKAITIQLDEKSTWNVTADSYVTKLIDADQTLQNINPNGHTVYYKVTDPANAALSGQTHNFPNGGKIVPIN